MPPVPVAVIGRANATRYVQAAGEDMVTKAPQIFPVPVGSTGSKVTIVIQDEAGNALDVSSGTSVLFHCKKKVAGVWTNVSRDNVAAFVTDGSNGQVEYDLTSTEVAAEADLYAEFEIVGYSGGNPLITDTFIVRVTDRARVPS